MAKKLATVFVCNECGYESSKWLGKCPGCNSWNTMEETLIAASHSRWINNGSLAKCQGIFSADMADEVLRRKFLKK